MKVSRQAVGESYSTTVDWISDFESGICKSSNYLDRLKMVMKDRADFNTIEEKMADIRTRAGFDIIKDVNNTINSKTASCCASCDTDSGSCSSCSCGKRSCDPCRKAFVEEIKSLLKYLSDFNKDRPEVGISAMLTHCRENPDLKFSQIESKVDSAGLRKLILEKLNLQHEDKDIVQYVPGEQDSSSANTGQEAEYYGHASPSV